MLLLLPIEGTEGDNVNIPVRNICLHLCIINTQSTHMTYNSFVFCPLPSFLPSFSPPPSLPTPLPPRYRAMFLPGTREHESWGEGNSEAVFTAAARGCDVRLNTRVRQVQCAQDSTADNTADNVGSGAGSGTGSGTGGKVRVRGVAGRG